ncbi:MAG: superoxide dismutase [bacterium]
MKILALEKDVVIYKGSDYSNILAEEAKVVWDLQKQNIIREIYFRADVKCAVIILECETTKDAFDMLQKLPLVQKGIIDFDIIPLTTYTGYERLFK